MAVLLHLESEVDTRHKMVEYFSKFPRIASVEQCGFLLWNSNDKFAQPVEVPNRHETPRYDFRITSQSLNFVNRTWPTMAILGIWHTHIERDNIEPSDEDLNGLEQLQRSVECAHWYGLVIHNRTRTLTYYNGRGILYQRHLVRTYDGTFVAKYGSGHEDGLD